MPSDATGHARPPVTASRRRLLVGGLAAAPLLYTAAAAAAQAPTKVVRERVTTTSPLAETLNTPSGFCSGNLSSPGLSSQFESGAAPDYWVENVTTWGAAVAAPSADVVQSDPAAQLLQPDSTGLPSSNDSSTATGTTTTASTTSGTSATSTCDQSTASAGTSSTSTSSTTTTTAGSVSTGGKPAGGGKGGSKNSPKTSLSTGSTTGSTKTAGGGNTKRTLVARVGSKDPSKLGATFASVFGSDAGLTPLAADDCTGSGAVTRSVTLYEVLAFPDDVSDTTIDGIPLGRFAKHVAGAYLNAVNKAKYPVRPQQVRAMWNDARTGAGFCPTGTCSAAAWYAQDVMAYLDTTW